MLKDSGQSVQEEIEKLLTAFFIRKKMTFKWKDSTSIPIFKKGEQISAKKTIERSPC